ncbi:MAG: hypothetical protein IPQ09_20540 [Myxococcales bacterium]|nr:hypothetical protein [Myxococcales bacterium]
MSSLRVFSSATVPPVYCLVSGSTMTSRSATTFGSLRSFFAFESVSPKKRSRRCTAAPRWAGSSRRFTQVLGSFSSAHAVSEAPAASTSAPPPSAGAASEATSRKAVDRNLERFSRAPAGRASWAFFMRGSPRT